MVVGSEESSDPGRDEDEPVVEIGKKLINITPFTGSDRNQAPGVCAWCHELAFFTLFSLFILLH